MKQNNGLTFLLVIAGFVIVLYLVHNWNNREAVPNEGEVTVDNMDNMSVSYGTPQMSEANLAPANVDPRENDGSTSVEGLVGATLQDDMNANDNEEAQRLRQASCFPKEQLLPEELLPQDNSSTWAQVNPQGMGTLKDKNFLQAGHHTGINTIGSTLRNASLDLRSEPSNPQVVVSPWLQTTIQPDTNRRPFEIGGCA
jgi:hypothetical protein